MYTQGPIEYKAGVAQSSRGGKRCSNKGEMLRSNPKKVSRMEYFFCILETESVTKISNLYKISSLKFILIFESKRAIGVLETRR